ncbi:hypothetical protein [Streptomyces sp. NPDC001480]|uniref:hypothetical protein n=1 Tax=Streptomyces sp. NPDC001480 TaxID=3364577 RepID=UPI0036C1C9FB
MAQAHDEDRAHKDQEQHDSVRVGEASRLTPAGPRPLLTDRPPTDAYGASRLLAASGCSMWRCSAGSSGLSVRPGTAREAGPDRPLDLCPDALLMGVEELQSFCFVARGRRHNVSGALTWAGSLPAG